MSFTKCWGLPPDLKITLTQFFTELEKYEEKDVNNWAVEKKISYYTEKMELLRGFLNNAKSGSNLSSSRPVSNTPQTTTVVQPKKETPKETVKETPRQDTFKETPKSEVKEIPRETVKETPKQVITNEPPKDDMVTTVRGIMNNVFRKVKAKTTSGTTYSGSEVMQTVKEIIIETTTSVINGNEHETTIKSIMNNVHKKIRASFVAEQTYGDNEVLDTVRDTIKTITNEVIAANSPPETNVSSKTVETSQPKRNEETSQPKRNEDSFRRVDSKSLGGSEGSQSAGIETQRRDAEARIKKNPTEKDVDLTDPEVLEYFIRVRDDKDPLTWIIYGYGDESKNRLQKIDCGEGNFDELKDNIPEYKPVYIYFKHVFGDTNRAKFIYITYTPESLNGIQKSRVLGHRGGVEEFFKYFQISWHIQDLNEIDEETLVKKLLSAGGANYSVQEKDKGNFTDYKTKTKNFYSETEKRGDNIKYSNDQTPLSLTPMDISGRPTVAPTTQFLGNTKDLKK